MVNLSDFIYPSDPWKKSTSAITVISIIITVVIVYSELVIYQNAGFPLGWRHSQRNQRSLPPFLFYKWSKFPGCGEPAHLFHIWVYRGTLGTLPRQRLHIFFHKIWNPVRDASPFPSLISGSPFFPSIIHSPPNYFYLPCFYSNFCFCEYCCSE